MSSKVVNLVKVSNVGQDDNVNVGQDDNVNVDQDENLNVGRDDNVNVDQDEKVNVKDEEHEDDDDEDEDEDDDDDDSDEDEDDDDSDADHSDDDSCFYDEWTNAQKNGLMNEFLTARYHINSDSDSNDDLDEIDENRELVFIEDSHSAEEKDGEITNAANKTPQDRFVERLKEAIGTNPGSVLIQGADDEDQNVDEARDYTDLELSRVRHIIVTPNRKKYLEKLETFTNPNEGFFCTSTSNQIVMGIPRHIHRAMTLLSTSDSFDYLFALTFLLWRDEYWLYDNEIWEKNDLLDKSVKQLAKAWRKILINSNADLGIDINDQYSKPGIECLLQKFQQMLSNCQYVNAKFKWH